MSEAVTPKKEVLEFNALFGTDITLDDWKENKEHICEVYDSIDAFSEGLGISIEEAEDILKDGFTARNSELLSGKILFFQETNYDWDKEAINDPTVKGRETLARDIERFIFERGEYNCPEADQIALLKDSKIGDLPLSRKNVADHIADCIGNIEFVPLFDYLNDQIKAMGESDELIDKAKDLISDMEERKSKEREHIRFDHKETQACSNAIVEAVKNNTTYLQYGQSIDLDVVVATIREEYSDERISRILAGEVFPYKDSFERNMADGRFSGKNKDWATVVICECEDFYSKHNNYTSCSIRDKTHATIVNSLIDRFSAALEAEKNKDNEMSEKKTKKQQERD